MKTVISPQTREISQILDDSIIPAYNESIKFYEQRNSKKTLGNFGTNGKDFTGSNPFILAHLINSGLFPPITRIAGRKDIETLIALDGHCLENYYVSFGLALKTAGDSYAPNDLLAKILSEQLNHKGVELENGKLIQIAALGKPIEADNSPYGLVFNLADVSGKELSDSGAIVDLERFRWDYTREGLSCANFFRTWCYGWSSDVRDLADQSDTYGRVIIINNKFINGNY